MEEKTAPSGSEEPKKLTQAVNNGCGRQSGSCSSSSSFISAKWCNRFEAKLKSDNKGEADSLSLLLSNVAPVPKGCLKLVKQQKKKDTQICFVHLDAEHTHKFMKPPSKFQLLSGLFIFSNHTQDIQRSVLQP